MPKAVLFVEDYGHAAFLVPVVRRIAEEAGVDAEIDCRSAQGGKGKALSELKDFLQELASGTRLGVPELLVVAIDANCKGCGKKLREINECVPGQFRSFAVYAIPDPHIERWLLLDSQAFKRILGTGCKAPKEKCEKDRYKNLLAEAVQQAGVNPLIGGLEHAKDIVQEMDLGRACKADPSFEKFVSELRRQLNALASGSN